MKPNVITTKNLLTFFSITLFYFFECSQISYFNVLAPHFLSEWAYSNNQVASLSASYYYGNMIGLIPIGILIDRLPLRKTLLWGMFASILSAFLLVISPDYWMQWTARFLCGFFGGACSFIGGIRVISKLFLHRFTLFVGLFLAAGMLAGLLCQYPFLIAVNHLGINGAMTLMAIFGLIVGIVNLFDFHPTVDEETPRTANQFTGSFWQLSCAILKNYKNWFDCFMIILLETPNSVLGTLWGVILLTGLYHLSATTSAIIIMVMYAGLMLGSPFWGIVADRYQQGAWIIVLGSGMSFISILMMLFTPQPSVIFIGLLFFSLGFFSSSQTLGFTWLTRNMQKELIGRNSAFNSLLFMGAGGIVKQIGAMLLAMPALLVHLPHASNLLVLIAGGMLLSTIYALIRHKIH